MKKYLFLACIMMVCTAARAETGSLIISNNNSKLFTVKYDITDWHSNDDSGIFEVYSVEENKVLIGYDGMPHDDSTFLPGHDYKAVAQFDLQQWYNMGLDPSGILDISLIIKRAEYSPDLIIEAAKIESIGDMVQLENGIIPTQTENIIPYYSQISNPINGFTGFYFPSFYAYYDNPEDYINMCEISVTENVLQDISQGQNWTGFIIEGEEQQHGYYAGDEVELKITYSSVPEPSVIFLFAIGLYPLLKKHRK